MTFINIRLYTVNFLFKSLLKFTVCSYSLDQIENEIYSGNADEVGAIENKMRTELRSFDELDLCEPSTMDERVFLEKNAGYKIVRSREGFFNWTNN